MAKQIGPIKLKGTIGGISFYTTLLDGDLVRLKGGPAKGRIAIDPAYASVRAHNTEFGRASAASKILRKSFGKLVSELADARLSSRLTQGLFRTLQTDISKPKGLRTVNEGAVHLLEGLDFNARCKLQKLLLAPYHATVDPGKNILELSMPAFVPTDSLLVPSETTHFRIFSIGTAVDFTNETFITSHSESEIMKWDATLTKTLCHRHQITEGAAKALFLAMGVSFYRISDGEFYNLEKGAYNTMSIVKATGGY